jgi:Flp pilus assembly protein TadB
VKKLKAAQRNNRTSE